MDREVFVYIDLQEKPTPVGRLWSRVRKGRESATFEYDPSWLEHFARFSLEPALTRAPGPFHTPADKALFGAIGDSAPDRWGRVLMHRAERRRAERVTNDEESDEDLRLRIVPDSSLGGARPKASVRDHDGHLALAKFPHRQDDINVVLWEGVALSLLSPIPTTTLAIMGFCTVAMKAGDCRPPTILIPSPRIFVRASSPRPSIWTTLRLPSSWRLVQPFTTALSGKMHRKSPSRLQALSPIGEMKPLS